MPLNLPGRFTPAPFWVIAVLLLTAGCQGDGSYRLHIVLPDARAQTELKDLRLQAIYLGKVDGDAACAELIAGTLVPPATSVRAEFSGSLDDLAVTGLPLVPALDLLFFVEGSRTVGLVDVPILRGCTPASVSAGATVEVTVELAWICDPDGPEIPANLRDDDCDGQVDECLSLADCDDENPCTDDACGADGECAHVNNRAACDDGFYCTTTDACAGGSCFGIGDRCPGRLCDEAQDACADCLALSDCDDSNPCTDDACANGGCTHASNTDPCDDGLFCTATDACGGGACQGTGSPCGTQACDEDTDACKSCQLDADCDDHNPCTDDSCALGQCGNTANDLNACADGLFCTVTDACVGGNCQGAGDRCPGQRCDESAKACVACLTPVDCDDGNPCTDDTCPDGSCAHAPNTAPCNDGLYCTATDTCAGGICAGIGGPCGAQACDEDTDSCKSCQLDAECDDSNPCTNDACPDGSCTHAANTDACDDGRYCTATDACAGGACLGSDNPCGAQACLEATDSCTECTAASECDDGNDCTDDACPDGTCSHLNNVDVCDDGRYCTATDTCAGGACVGAGNPCGAGACLEDTHGCGAAGPTLLSPTNGFATGSPHAPGGLAVHALKPEWIWLPAQAGEYEIQVDDSCEAATRQGCTFPSPELSQRVATTRYRPTAALPVAQSVPVGTRYYWRVRGCDGATCTGWSEVRYLDVGRLADDLNGDGYSDLAVGAPGQHGTSNYEGAVFVYHGSPSGIAAAPTTTLVDPGGQANDRFGFVVAAAGDLNADGYADLAVGAPSENAPEYAEGNTFVYLGGPSGLPDTPSITLDNPADQAYANFGNAVAGAGDLNGDGYADLAVGAQHQTAGAAAEGNAFVYYGGAGGVATTPGTTLDNPDNQADGNFGEYVAGAGDLNADGYADLAVGAPAQDFTETKEGSVFVYLGGPGGAATTPVLSLHNPQPKTYGRFGIALAGRCDLNADGYSDLALGTPLQDGAGLGVGRVHLYLGGPEVLPLAPNVTIDNPAGADGSNFGWKLSCAGDLDADGRTDLVAGAPFQSGDQASEGFVFLYKGAAGGPAITPSLTIENPGNQAFSRFGWAVAIAGDVTGDGYSDLVAGAVRYESGATQEGAVFFFNCTASGVPASPTRRLDNPANQAYGEFGSAVAALILPGCAGR